MTFTTENGTVIEVEDSVAEDKAKLFADYLDYLEGEFDNEEGGFYSAGYVESMFEKGLGLLYSTVGDYEEYEVQATIYPNKLELTLEVWGEDGETTKVQKYNSLDEMREDCFYTMFGTWDEMWGRLMDAGYEGGLLDKWGNVPTDER